MLIDEVRGYFGRVSSTGGSDELPGLGQAVMAKLLNEARSRSGSLARLDNKGVSRVVQSAVDGGMLLKKDTRYFLM